MVTNNSAYSWRFNGDAESPTFYPSIKVTGKRDITDDECERIMRGEKIEIEDFCCHSFVTAGNIQFLSDCTHKLKGQTVELPEIEQFFSQYKGLE
jgi:hypothetical protein